MITADVDTKHWDRTYAESFSTNAPVGTVGKVYGPSVNGYVGWQDTDGKGEYNPDKVLRVTKGHLVAKLFAIPVTDRKDKAGNPITALGQVASVWPATKIVKGRMSGKRYGKVRFRMRATGSPHFKVVGEGWTADDSWRGEVCFPEGNVGGQAWINVHNIYPPHERNVVSEPIPGVYLKDWHTYDIEIGPGYQVFRVIDTGYIRWVLNPEAQFPVDWRAGLQSETATDGSKLLVTDKATVEIDNWQEWDFIG